MSQQQITAIRKQIEEDIKLSADQRMLLEKAVFDASYADDDVKYSDSNWNYLRSLSDEELIEKLEN